MEDNNQSQPEYINNGGMLPESDSLVSAPPLGSLPADPATIPQTISPAPLDPAALTSTTIKPSNGLDLMDTRLKGPVPTAPIFRNRWLGRAIYSGIGLLTLSVLVSGAWLIYRAQTKKLGTQVASSTASPADNVPATNVDLTTVNLSQATVNNPQVTVNGQLKINDQAVLAPSARPADPTIGQIYLDSGDHNLYFYNGTSFNSLGQTTTNIINSNNSGVSSLLGQTGAITLVGSNGLTITPTGGNISLALPQDLTVGGSPSFSGLSLSSIGANSVLVGGGGSPITGAIAGSTGLCLLSTGGAPDFLPCPSASGAPTTADYLTLSANANLSNERALTAGTNIAFTDNGANSTLVIATAADPNFGTSVTTPMLQSTGTLSITAASSITIGSTNQPLTLQGNASTALQISDSGNVTNVVFSPPTANHTIIFPNAGGTVCLQTSASCGFAMSGSGVASVNGGTGVINIANASNIGPGGTIVINNAKADSNTSATKGIATFNNTDFVDDGNGVIDTIQAIGHGANPQFTALTLTGDLTLGATGVIHTNSITHTGTGHDISIDAGANNITFSNMNGANTFVLPTTGGTGQQICTSGIICATGGGQAVILEPSGVQAASANKTSLFIDKTGGTGDLVELETGSPGVSALRIDNTGATTIKGLTVTNDETVSGTLTVNTITPTGDLAIGATNQKFTLQGTDSSTIVGTNGSHAITVGFRIGTAGLTPTGNITYNFPFDNSISAGTYDICTKAGNCVGLGGTLTGSGTAGAIPKFSTSSNLGDSIISDNGIGAITIAGDLAVTGVNGTTLGSASVLGKNTFLDGTGDGLTVTLQPTTLTSTSKTILIPNASGTLAVSASGPLSLNTTTGALSCSTCLTSGGGGGTAGVVSVQGNSGGSALTGALVLNNTSGTGVTLTIDSAGVDGTTKGIAAFNATNFKLTTGAINTIQDITQLSNPVFNNMTLQGSGGLTLGSTSNAGKMSFLDGTADGFNVSFQPSTLSASRIIVVPNAAGTMVINASGNLSRDSSGNVTIVGNPVFSASVTTPILQSAGTLAITPGGALTVGTAGQTFTLVGAIGSQLTVNAQSFTFPTLGGEICTSAGSANCTTQYGTGGGGANQQLSNLSGTVAVNQALNPTGDNGIDIGSLANSWRTIYADTSVLTPTIDVAAAGTLSVGTSLASTVNVGTNNAAHTIAIGNNAGSAQAVTLGSTNASSTTTLQGGAGSIAFGTSSGNIAVAAAAGRSFTITATNASLDSAGVLTLLGGNSQDITTSSQSLAIQPGSISTSSGTAPALSLKGADHQGSSCSPSCTAGSVTLQGGNATGSSGPRNGGNATIDAGTGATINGSISIGTTNATAINIGKNSANATTTVTGLSLFKPSTGNDSATAFQVQNAAGNANVLTADTTSGRVVVGPLYSGNVSLTAQLQVTGKIPAAELAHVSTSGAVDATPSIFVQGRYLYEVNEASQSLNIFDISNPASVTALSSRPLTGSGPTSVYVQGHYAYISTFTSDAIEIVDVTNPGISTSTTVSTLSTGSGSGPSEVYVSGRYAYVSLDNNAANGNAIATIDVANPNKPVVASHVATTGATFPNGLYASAGYLYVACKDAFKIYSLSNPSTPSLVNTSTTGLTSQYVGLQLAAQGKYVYMPNADSNNVQIYNVSNPASIPAPTVYTPAGSGAILSVVVQGRYMYVTVASPSNVIQVVDISNPASPVSVGTMPITSTSASNPIPQTYLAVSGRYLYSVVDAAGSAQLQSFDLGGAYVQQAETGALETNSLQVNANSNFFNDVNVQGGLTIGQSLQLNGNLGSSGQALFQNAANSTTAFQVQNTAGTNTVFDVDTTNGRVGIGTAVPNAVLHVAGNTGSSAWGLSGVGLRVSSAVYTDSSSTGTVSTVAASSMSVPTITGALGTGGSHVVYTDAATFYIGGGPIGGTNTDITNAYALWSAGKVLVRADSTKVFQIQNAANSVTVLNADTTGSGTLTVVSTVVNGTLTVNGHLKSTQTVAPLISTPTSCGSGTGPSAAVTAGSTDTAGSFTITAGSTGSPTTCVTQLSFNVAYGAAPKSIVLTATSATGAARTIYISATVAGSFSVTYSSAPANSEANTYNYVVIE